MAKILERKLSSGELKINQGLKPPEIGAPKKPIESPRLKERMERAEEKEAERKKMEKLIVESPLGLELLAIDGQVSVPEIESIPDLDESFRKKLLEIAKLHEKIEILKMKNVDLEGENLTLRREMKKLRKTVG